MPSINHDISWNFFGGTSQDDLTLCEGGIVLFVNSNHHIFLKHVVGQDSKNKVEFLALWVLLKEVEKIGMKQFQVFDDSKLLIYRTNHHCNI